jgi:hypothetical protein
MVERALFFFFLTMTDNVRAFPGQSKPNGEPQIPLINLLENLTERANFNQLHL